MTSELSKSEPHVVPTELWPHQEEAVEYLRDGKYGHLLWCAMGTGKSLIAIEFARRVHLKKILILCPLSVVNAWQQEFDKHTEYGEWYFAGLDKGSVAERAQQVRALGMANKIAVAINYESFWRKGMIDSLLKVDWDLIICDEIHRIKTASSKQSRGAFKLASKVNALRLGLSGTPFPNTILDAFGSYKFLDSNIFGRSFVGFRSTYAIVTTKPGFPLITGFQNTEMFRDKVHSIAFKVDSDVLHLPEATHVERTFDLPPAAQKLYLALRDDFIAEVDDGAVTASNALVRLLRLQQMTSGDAITERITEKLGEVIIEEGHTEIHNAKSKVLEGVLGDLDEPLVIFYRFKRDLDRIVSVCENRGIPYSELSGRKKELVEWQEEKTKCIAVQLRAGSEGISLVRARVAVFWSLSFNLAEFEQSKARLNRPGQKRAVSYIHLIAEGTVDRTVLSALKEKKNVIETILAKPHTL